MKSSINIVVPILFMHKETVVFLSLIYFVPRTMLTEKLFFIINLFFCYPTNPNPTGHTLLQQIIPKKYQIKQIKEIKSDIHKPCFMFSNLVWAMPSQIFHIFHKSNFQGNNANCKNINKSAVCLYHCKGKDTRICTALSSLLAFLRSS